MEAIRTAFREFGHQRRRHRHRRHLHPQPLFPFLRNYVSVELDGKPSRRPSAHRLSAVASASPRSRRHHHRHAERRVLRGDGLGGFRARHWSHFHDALNELGLLSPRIRYVYVAHHRAHAASTFRLAGMSGQKALCGDPRRQGRRMQRQRLCRSRGRSLGATPRDTSGAQPRLVLPGDHRGTRVRSRGRRIQDHGSGRARHGRLCPIRSTGLVDVGMA